MKRVRIWFLAAALVATPAAPVLSVYLYYTLGDPNCPEIFVGSDVASVAVFFGAVAAVVLSYMTFVVASPRPRGTGWRYAVGVPVAVIAGIAVVVSSYAMIEALPRPSEVPGIVCD